MQFEIFWVITALVQPKLQSWIQQAATKTDPGTQDQSYRSHHTHTKRSVGVIRQIATAFKPRGLTSSDGRVVYPDPTRLAKVTAPTMFLVGDMDRMCPPGGAVSELSTCGVMLTCVVCKPPPCSHSNQTRTRSLEALCMRSYPPHSARPGRCLAAATSALCAAAPRPASRLTTATLTRW